jgi:selenocysteine-specific elongation factor
MKSVIVGTAGHIDHGKTALVKALTGIDADRLQEEKRRGITIDLGFAHLELPHPERERLRFGFVDVPGHERFVRNMLAGVGGIDLVLLVIAADEGIKPQTREHFDICRLLAVERGITVLTKADLVDAETLQVVRLEVEDFLRGSFLENFPIVPVSSLAGTGLEQLRQELARVASEVPARDSSAITRLPIDRVFTMKGFGTVVTGTLVAGNIGKEDDLDLFPARRKVRVRGVQVHGVATENAVEGERTALNLAGVEKDQVARGMMLAAAGMLQPSTRLDVRLSLLPSAKPLKTGSRVHLHAFAAEMIAVVRPYEAKQLQAAAQGLAQLHLSDPIVAVPGDRFIIRQFSPVVTIGGGVVLDAFPLRKMAARTRLDFLRLQLDTDLRATVLARVARRAQEGITLGQLTVESGRTASVLEPVIGELVRSAALIRRADLLLDSSALGEITANVIRLVSEFHSKNPLTAGISKESLRKQAGLSARVFDTALDLSTAKKQLCLTADLVHLPGRGVVMKDEETASRQLIEQTFAAAGLKVPALKDVLAGLRIDRTRAQQIVTLLLREKILIKISDDLVFHRSALDRLRTELAAQKTKAAKIDVAGFKELSGVSRKYAIPLLEYLDRERVTRRVGDERIIL